MGDGKAGCIGSERQEDGIFSFISLPSIAGNN
jgi:hypothetical protein